MTKLLNKWIAKGLGERISYTAHCAAAEAADKAKVLALPLSALTARSGNLFAL